MKKTYCTHAHTSIEGILPAAVRKEVEMIQAAAVNHRVNAPFLCMCVTLSRWGPSSLTIIDLFTANS